MIIISEKLNSSIPSVGKIIATNDIDAVNALIDAQINSGADFLDVNTAVCENELESGRMIFDAVINKGGVGIVIDSPSTDIVEKQLEYISGRASCIINSVALNERHENIELAKKYGASLIVMLTDENGIPDTAEKRYDNAVKMISMLENNEIEQGRIYIDAIIESAAVSDDSARITLDTIKRIREAYPQVHITCGVSNISFGLPKRSYINSAFITLATYFGLDAPICDITSPTVKPALLASQLLAGRDEYCMEYIEEMGNKLG